MIKENKYYTIEDLSKLLKISQKVIRRKIASGVLEYERIGGKYAIVKKDLNLLESIIAKDEEFEMDLFGHKNIVPRIAIDNGKYVKKIDVINWVNILDKWKNPGKSKLSAVDLFCGAGGISKGFELAGINCICGLDWFEAAGKTYRRNFHHSFVEGDIRDKIVKKKFYDTVNDCLKGKTLNIIAGGFPCQGFSMAGHRIVSDERNILYREMLDIVRTLSPEFVVMENVVGLRTMLKGKIEEKIMVDLKNMGYSVNVTTLCAADYYVPQKRNRVIFIANKIGLSNYHPMPLLLQQDYMTTKMAIQDLMSTKDNPTINHVATKHNEEMQQRLMAVREGESLYENYSDAWKKCPWDEASCTIKENHGGVNIHPKLPRVLTVREMARLQSFPDDFIFEGTKSKQMVQIGNAVPPLLAKAIGLSIRSSYENVKPK